jgi:glycosyltransferase involved in cell wall biosynthesis
MRTVYVTSQAPLPEHSGHARRLSAQLRVLRTLGPVDLLVLGCRPPPAVRAATAAEWPARFYPARIERPVAKAARQVMAAVRGESAWMAKALSPARLADIEETVRSVRPDVVILAETWLSRLIGRVRPHAGQVILDNQNVESRLYARIMRSSGGLARLKAAFTWANMLQLERGIEGASKIWACSDEDRAFFGARVGEERVHVVPNVVDMAAYDGFVRPERPRSIVFSGGYGYQPNETGALNLIALSRRLAAAGTAHELVLVGARPTPAMRSAAEGQPQIRITGFVPDTRDPVAAASLFVAPLDEGSGTKFKLLEAMALGRAIVTSPVGAEGMGLVPGRDVVIADGQDAFAAAITCLLDDAEARRRMGEAALATVRHRYTLDVLAERIRWSLEQ